MADHTKIEWTDATWNPITGCSVVSPGCTNCYAMKLAGTRLQHHPSRAGLTTMSKAGPVWNGEVRFNEEWLTQPLAWKRPRRIFVCAHGDLFHESVPDEWIDRVFAVMALAPQHTFQVLTKRSARMRQYVSNVCGSPMRFTRFAARGADIARSVGKDKEAPPLWPLPNVWLGVSAEDQQRADERIPDLLATPAAIRWVSAEPLLGPIDLTSIDLDGDSFITPLASVTSDELAEMWGDGEYRPPLPKLDWIVAGGESGPGARPMHPLWARSIRDQCQAAGVPFLFKQWGQWAPWDGDNWEVHAGWDDVEARDRLWRVGGTDFLNVGKKRAGRLLDGRTWDEYPETAISFERVT